MKIFIDSADLSEIEYAYGSGIIDGVTTNPSLIKKAVNGLKEKGQKIDMKAYIEKMLKTARGTPVSLEVTETERGKMVAQGKDLFRIFNPIADNVCIKIPVNASFEGETGKEYEGIKAVKELSEAGIPVNCTLIFTPEQALLAAKAGARYVSPFAGRIDDLLRKKNNVKSEKTDYFPAEGMTDEKGMLKEGWDDNGVISGIDLVKKTVNILKRHNLKTEVIAASLRNTRQVRESALAGAHIATIPFSVIQMMLSHPKTEEGMKRFTEDIVPEYSDLTK